MDNYDSQDQDAQLEEFKKLTEKLAEWKILTDEEIEKYILLLGQFGGVAEDVIEEPGSEEIRLVTSLTGNRES